MSRSNPYGYGPSTLNYLAHTLAHALAGYVADTPPPNNPQRPIEPWSGLPREPSTDTAAEANALRNPSAKYEGEAAVEEEMDKANTESWVQRMQEARDLAHPKAAKARADKKATQDWINRMRAAKEGQSAVDKEMDKANTEAWTERMKQAKGAQAPQAQPLTPEDFGMKTAPPPMPLTPPGQVFGPAEAAPTEDDLAFIQRRRDWIRKQGLNAIEREIKE